MRIATPAMPGKDGGERAAMAHRTPGERPREEAGDDMETHTPAPYTPPARRAPPSHRDRLRRALWETVALVLVRPTPPPLHGWRRFWLRRFGARIGPRAAVYPSAKVWAPWNLVLGPGATVGPGARLYNVAPIEIGANAIVSQGAHLCTASHDHTVPTFDLVAAPIAVEADVWIAADAFIGPGVRLAEGAVVGARAVVMRSLAPREVAAGNPACVIGHRPASARNALPGRQS
ncbi:putative colanic acid biosynthesis acetyltransferase [Acuticoccus sp. M5D2P5]|uniref:putative colanic acid biosynthesis acetyltransferase n=1 Tax=Acuticoccus kalidii TaxID=2910977 RepID=UPI001F23EB56|nr:putative colanic acid biosynthesis acetyltransferase [Acuticoccus kalidii]MCF3933739.1 putative colanic acid biosynthesis acetyltransferase [Acuticoccus kalidii]